MGAALAAITIVGLWFRIVGNDFGRPYVYHPDEWLIAKPAMHMAATGSWNPEFFYYPSALIYLEEAVAIGVHAVTGVTYEDTKPTTFGGLAVRENSEAVPQQFDYYLGGRFLVAVLGALTAAVTFFAGRAVAGTIGGLVAALVAALAPVAVAHSHFLTTDAPAGLAVAAVLAIALRFPDNRRGLLFAGLAAGFAASTKYNAALVGVVPLLLALTGPWPGRSRLALAAGVIVAAIAGFVMFSPALLFELSTAAAQFRGTVVAYSTGAESSAAFWINYLWEAGLHQGFMLAAVLGIVVAIARRSRTSAALLAFAGVYFVVVSLATVRFERNLLPLIPALAVLAGIAARAFALPAFGPLAIRLALMAATVIVLGVGTMQAIDGDRYFGYAFRRPDTRTLAADWINANVPSGTRIVREYYTPQPSPERYEVGVTWHLSDHPLEWYRSNGVRFLVASDFIYPTAVDGETFYAALFALPVVFDKTAAELGCICPRIVIVDLGA